MPSPAPSAARARTRRRRWPWVLLAVLVVLAVLLVVADRVTHSYAQDTVAEQLGKNSAFSSTPDVEIEGTPFLTQALAGDYRHVTVSGDGLTLGKLEGVTFHADLYGVHVPLSDAVSGSVSSVPIDRAQGTVVIPYAQLAKQTGIADLAITEDGGTLTVKAPVDVDVAFFHESFDVVADGSVRADGQDLALSVDNIRVAGISLPGFAVDFISDYLNSRIDLPALPYGLQLQSVQAQSDGLHVAVAGTDLTVSGT